MYYSYGSTHKSMAKRSGKPPVPQGPRGEARTGRIVRLLVGQNHGFIRLTNQRDVFFHRADLQEGTAFNDLQVGDTVKFELFEDAVSGARALRIVRRTRSR